MSPWFVFALMTTAAVFAVLWPLGRGARTAPGGSETLVYKDQLAEIARDAKAGLIGAPEAEAARVEIGRRLLAASASEQGDVQTTNVRFRRAVSVIALVGLPLIAAAFYLQLGSPMLGDFPLADRMRTASATDSLDKLVAQVEAVLEKNPADGRGWNVLAPVLMKLGRFDDAVRAYRNSITYNGETAARRSDLGEALAAAANGVVTGDAKSEFERALALDTQDFKARYFIALAAEQDGRTKEAGDIWRAMLANAPQDAPWKPLVQAALARLGGIGAPRLSEGTMSSADGMDAGDRSAPRPQAERRFTSGNKAALN
ncbi:MAG: c-type cytochrome biogenesis protein CcmI, partial [Xanthobacteraceae bacterium]|nr:c-type cytochrome biogenesis protein CcmI [Xanthobacteraceae bacterium]